MDGGLVFDLALSGDCQAILCAPTQAQFFRL